MTYGVVVRGGGFDLLAISQLTNRLRYCTTRNNALPLTNVRLYGFPYTRRL